MGKGPGKGKYTGPQAAVLGKFERNLLRMGLHNKKERDILLRRARKLDAAQATTSAQAEPVAQHDPELKASLEHLAAQPQTWETKLAEAHARGLTGAGVDDTQVMRRLARARAADDAAKEREAARAITPAAASALASLRAEFSTPKEPPSNSNL